MLDSGGGVFDEPLRVDMRAEFSIPKRMPKGYAALALTGVIRPFKKPDIDNLYKIAADAFNGIVWRDDALVVEARLSKFYSNQPKLVITVQPAAPPLADMVCGLPNDTLETMIDEGASL